MHTEHLQNVRPTWVAFGWFLGAAVFSAVFFALVALKLVDAEGEGSGLWLTLAMFVGYLAGGYFTGARVGAAPILHAVGIGLFSIIVWFLINLFFGEPLGAETWGTLSAELTAGLVLLQIAAAAIGARLGSRSARAATAPGS